MTLPRPLIIAIIGPTAVGKTAISLGLAKILGGEIVSADSRLFYTGMDIGTAKPSQEVMAEVPHHLVNIAPPDETISLAEYQARAYQAMDDILARKKTPILVGGTGQYIRAITAGWQIPRQEPDPRLRAVLNQWAEEVGAETLHKRLSIIDPEAASNIDFRNVRRTIRALEVIFHSGRRFSSLRKTGSPRYRSLLIGLNRPREILYQRIDDRIDQMLADGLVEEVRGLYQAGYDQAIPAMSAIGYREILQHLTGELSLEEAVQRIKKNTRTFVRRQANWFKPDDPDIQWFAANEATPEDLKNLVLNFQNKSPKEEFINFTD
jgi:tRNA dimethylallyltransferase